MTSDIEELLDDLVSPYAHKAIRDGFRDRINRFIAASLSAMRAERDEAREKLGECHAGYETLRKELAAAQAERGEARKALEWRSPETAPAWTTVLIACQSHDLQFAAVARRNEDTGVWEDDEGDEYSDIIGWKPIVMPNGFSHGGSPARAALGKRGER